MRLRPAQPPDGKRIAIAIQNCHLDTIKNPVLRLNSRNRVGDKIELLLPDADEIIITDDFQYDNDGNWSNIMKELKKQTVMLREIKESNMDDRHFPGKNDE